MLAVEFLHAVAQPAVAHGQRFHHHPRGVRGTADVADLPRTHQVGERAQRLVDAALDAHDLAARDDMQQQG